MIIVGMAFALGGWYVYYQGYAIFKGWNITPKQLWKPNWPPLKYPQGEQHKGEKTNG